MSISNATELVVLVDELGQPIGTADKATVHTKQTPRHLAFSCYLFNPDGKLLLSRRAVSKVAWPGVWTNSFCGHPLPDESFEEAIHRRALVELGLDVAEIQSAIPDFAYRAVDASGIVEHEFCPVFTAVTTAEPRPNPDEVAEFTWVDLDDVRATARTMPELLSPWMVLQLPKLIAHE